MHLIEDFRQHLASEEITPEIASHLPMHAQYAWLWDAVMTELRRYSTLLSEAE